MNKKKLGRPTDNPKKRRFEIRLTDNQFKNLTECSEKLNITKTDVIITGIELVKKNLDKQK